MGKVLEQREASIAAGNTLGYVDAIEWFRQVSKGRKYDPVHVQLTLSFVAIHTTADMLTQLMFDLAEHPEYIQPLREEVINVLSKHGWRKTSSYNMKLMDSVLKECQRLRPINDSEEALPYSMSLQLFLESTLYTQPLSFCCFLRPLSPVTDIFLQ